MRKMRYLYTHFQEVMSGQGVVFPEYGVRMSNFQFIALP